MNPRERILAALQHREADRIPIDFGAMRSTGIVGPAYRRLKEYLELEGPAQIYDLFQWLAEPEIEIMDRFGADVVQLHRPLSSFNIWLRDWKEWRDSDGHEYLVPGDFNPSERVSGGLEIRDPGFPDRILAVRSAQGIWFDPVYFPLAGARSIQDIDAHDWDATVMSDEEINELRRSAELLTDGENRAVLGEFGANLFEGGHFDFGYQSFMEMLVLEPDLALYYLDKKTDSHIKSLQKYLPAVGRHIQVIQLGDDLGMQQGPQISVPMYREMIKPFHERIFRYIKDNSDLYIFLHSCGSISDFLPDLIEIGVDIINPVQFTARRMDPRWLKKEFGKSLTFWGGGIDTQGTLRSGSSDRIEAECRELIEIFAPGGGYVFTQVHNIQSDVKPAAVVLLYRTAREYGIYPIAGKTQP